MGDATRLRQILNNLVSNAVKFTEHGAITVRIRQLSGARPGAALLEISVQDTGIGLTPDQAARLFQPFVQAEASTTRRFGGTGLGLAICRRLARLMGGDITVESAAGRGSTFRVRLEAQIAQPPQRLDEEDQAEASGQLRDITGLHILVVEDNPVNCAVARAVLAASGAEITVASDGVEALEALRRGRFDVVLMDIHMPRMDGVEALTAIRAGETGDPDTTVIALTADAMEGEALRLLYLGFDAVQPKPIQPAQLIMTIALQAQASRGRRLPIQATAPGVAALM
jgi:CheY-like chemotaxis protein